MLLVSLLCGVAISFNLGAYSEPALACVLVALGIIVFCLFESATAPMEGSSRFSFVALWLGLLGVAFYDFNDIPLIYAVRPWVMGHFAEALVFALLLTYAPFVTGRMREPSFLRWARFSAVAATIAVAGADTIRSSPVPQIDVWTVQQAGAAALLNGRNPYATVAELDTGLPISELVTTDAVGNTEHQLVSFYPRVPYVYPPTQLLLTLPAYALTGDVRFTMVAALLLAGLGMRFLTARANADLPSIMLDAPALSLWLMMKVFFIIEQSWIDPVQVMLITAFCVALVARRSWPAAVLLGVILGAKQTMFWAVGLGGFLLRFDRKQWATTILVALAPALPFALANFPALKYANFDFLTKLPPRIDALTFNNWFAGRLGIDLPGAVGFVFAAGIVAFSIVQLKGAVSRFGIALVATYAFFFSFNKWAFANYYFAIGAFASLAAAASFHGDVARLRSPESSARPALSPLLREGHGPVNEGAAPAESRGDSTA
jgi:hypothetical protein